MKILSTEQMRKTDAATIEAQNISSEELMERAGNCLTQKILRLADYKSSIKIFCGAGNNGGDGLVVARLLFQNGHNVDCYYIKSEKYSADFSSNLKKLERCSKDIIHQIDSAISFPTIEYTDIVIDALFGSGLNRKIEGILADLIKHINNSKAQIIAIDTPSGLGDYAIPNDNDAVICANRTLTIQSPFLSMLLPENYRYTGDIDIIDIGLNQNFINQLDTPFSTYGANEARFTLPIRPKFAHKGTFGHSLLIAGAYCKTGAAILCCKACHRTGTGLLTVHIPQKCINIMQTASPETMVSADQGLDIIESSPDIEKFSAIGIGPGIGTHPKTAEALFATIKKATDNQLPLVLDADALNIIGNNKQWLNNLPTNTILTPHIKEFDRIFGESKNNLERIEKICQNTKHYSIIIVLKGAYTAVGLPDGTISFNTSGNPAMATAGSGDVLTGIITALLAQKLTPKNAARYGVYIHGAAGDIAAKEIGNCGITAQDIIKYIPFAVENTKKPEIPF
ncbi:MAG: NAD(P)H-hydrate dehydratase [Bacteroidales bacterium]|nr:NAD(P)H-hydrate dehydratase [Bacteroidales bacterium]